MRLKDLSCLERVKDDWNWWISGISKALGVDWVMF